MVEFAIIAPLIFMLMLGVTELGRAIVRYNTLTKALHEAARYASAYGLVGGVVQIDAGLDTEIRNLAVYGDVQGNASPLLEGLTTGQIDVSVPAPGQIQVAASYPYVPLFGSAIPTFGYGDGTNIAFDMQAAVTMTAL
jgi:Flp pilus assembly protein TadG